jgi:hypothetical protein
MIDRRRLTPTLADAAQHGRLVVFCGSGLSKGAPSYLPDWRSLNQFVLDEARAAALRALPGLSSSSAAAVESLSLAELPVASFSDQLVTLAAGSAWFEFLRLLDSEQTNAGHRALAELAEAGTLAAIASTNFDTLIERAFGERGRPTTPALLSRCRSTRCTARRATTFRSSTRSRRRSAASIPR